VTVRRREVELSIERPVGPGAPPGSVARLAARFDTGPGGEGPSPAELRVALDQLSADLDGLVGPLLAAAPVARPDRELNELVETYRPRQKDLVDLLRDDGELTPGEHGLLIAYLGRLPAAAAPPPRRAEAPTEHPLAAVPIAAAPVAAERSLPPARPVPELLRTYQIDSLRQAGAVRARRQISFAEYMALKRHFEEAEQRTRSAPERS
jgi:hypothetical protein